MLSLYAFLNITENIKNQEVGSGRVKGKNDTASAVIYTYRLTSCVVALKRPSGSSVKRLLWSHLEKQKPNSSVRLCIPLTHSDQTGMRGLYIIHVQPIYRGLSVQGISCNANQKLDCNLVMPCGIIMFYIPASIRDYYHVLHTSEEAMDCTCS